MHKCAVLILAAGRGSRFGDSKPKQYAQLGIACVLRHSIAAFSQHPAVQHIQPVIHPDDHALFSEAIEGLTVLPAVSGGATRQDSVLQGLQALQSLKPDIVLVHDGARPNIPSKMIDDVIAGLSERAVASIPAIPVSETLKRVGPDGMVQETVSRDNIVRAQTPQGFKYQVLLEAHQTLAGQVLTDDAAVMEKAGHAVQIVPGDPDNIKITTLEDLQRMSDLLSETRIGNGFDVHRLGPGASVILGGISIEHDRSLMGHSDADVVLHAATDAILGSISDHDIGFHFPPNDETFKGVESSNFLRFAMKRLAKFGGTLRHLDLTIICERPKISDHRDDMRASVASIAGVTVDRVSVKATTTEGLGATGRGEGIACQAIATVSVPHMPA